MRYGSNLKSFFFVFETESIKAFCCPNSNKEVIVTRDKYSENSLIYSWLKLMSNLLESKPNERIGMRKEIT